MGMLFNNDATLLMIQIVHDQFNNNWATLQDNKAFWVPRFQALGQGAGADPTFDVLNLPPLNINHPNLPNRWKAWLRRVDATGAGAAQVSNQIGNMIADAINNTGRNFAGVEFFAVPDSNISASSQDLPQNNPATIFTKCITIKTVTVDGLHP
jgi:hypothetical protein